jgi:hypothetical protein
MAPKRMAFTSAVISVSFRSLGHLKKPGGGIRDMSRPISCSLLPNPSSNTLSPTSLYPQVNMRGIKAIFALVAAANTSVLAAPNGDPSCCGTPSCPSPCPPACPSGCLDDLTSKKLAATWLYFGVNIDRTLALELLAPNFTYYSDSENLVGLSGVS